ncbi:MAG: sulfite exporter TauE/SafE family protein [Solitalea-like symbiont of Acarus siro]
MGVIFMIEAFVYGLSGAIHCLGMCGPLALWIPTDKTSKFRQLLGIVIYSLGRIVSYTFIGLVVGMVGVAFKVIGFQDVLSIASGIILILMSFTFTKKVLSLKLPFINKVYVVIKRSFDYVLLRIKNNNHKLFFIGVINGFLPCGFLYFAVITATSLGVIWGSVFYMIAFGLGTIPVFMLLSFLKSFINVKYNRFLQFILPIITIIIGIILILRGLNLGIPMISPGLNKIIDGHQNHMHCH